MNWNVDIRDSQNFYNVLKNKLINIVDRLVPYREVKEDGKRNKENPQMKWLVKLKRRPLNIKLSARHYSYKIDQMMTKLISKILNVFY